MDILISVSGKDAQKIFEGTKRSIVLKVIPKNYINKIYLFDKGIRMVTGFVIINATIETNIIEVNNINYILPLGLGNLGLKKIHGAFIYLNKINKET